MREIRRVNLKKKGKICWCVFEKYVENKWTKAKRLEKILLIKKIDWFKKFNSIMAFTLWIQQNIYHCKFNMNQTIKFYFKFFCIFKRKFSIIIKKKNVEEKKDNVMNVKHLSFLYLHCLIVL